MHLASGIAALDVVQQGQRGSLMPWSAVAFGVGVALYFALPVEPSRLGYGCCVAVVIVSTALAWRRRDTFGPVAIALALIAAGVLVAGVRAHQVAGPVLDFRYYGPIEGRVVAMDRSASDAPRLMLDRVQLNRVAPEDTPRRVRISVHGDTWGTDPEPGTTVMLTGHLSPPSGPAEPGGFDFQRHAWFMSLGAVGYTRNPVMLLEPRARGDLRLFHLRMRLSTAIQGAIPGQPGAFAAAVLTGDRSGLDRPTIDAMRDSNIAHLLAISGLHMGLLTGFVFFALRFGLALIPGLALRHPIRKWAAAAAMVVGAFYLAMSGGNVATERAFIQVSVMFTAVLLDRRAITLRSVAIAALIVLAHRPETLMSPGFQMSFAATAALVGVFAALRDREAMRHLPKWARGVAALVISSAVAGAATAPFAAAHFNQIASFGLLANLLSVPVMGSLVIPAAVVAALLWPIGLAWVPLAAMEVGLRWILAVSAEVSSWSGATVPIVAPPAAVLGWISLGALMVLIWQGRARWVGVLPVIAAVFLWFGADRPQVLISETGRLVGLWGEDARGLSRDRGDGFVARIWLENDGDAATQADAAARAVWQADGYGASAELGGLVIWHGSGRRAFAEAEAACSRADIVVVSEAVETDSLVAARQAALEQVNRGVDGPMTASAAPVLQSPTGCLVFDRSLLQNTGALALSLDATDLRIETAVARQGQRLWSPPAP